MANPEHGHKINETVEKLGEEINCMCVSNDDIKKAFLQLHPYHLNQIALGLMGAINHRQRQVDGRILQSLRDFGKELDL